MLETDDDVLSARSDVLVETVGVLRLDEDGPLDGGRITADLRAPLVEDAALVGCLLYTSPSPRD